MKVIELTGSGTEALVLTERPMPEPGPTEVVLRMLAASLNYRDVEIVHGTYHTRFPFPLVPLSDGVGEVVAIGSEVKRVALGQRVCTTFWQDWTGGTEVPDGATLLGGPLDGVLAEYVKADQQNLVPVPAHLSDEQASTFPCAGVTAWHSLVTLGKIMPGDTVLVQGTGGVALFALQFAKAAGARVIATSSSDAKLERARELDADGVINYVKNPEWGNLAREMSGGRGVDHVIEVGGPGTFNQSLAAVRPGGQISVIGYLGGTEGHVNPLDIFRKRLTVRGIPVGSRDSAEAMMRCVDAQQLQPVVDKVFAWKEAAQALHHLKSGSHVGKVVLRFGQ